MDIPLATLDIPIKLDSEKLESNQLMVGISTRGGTIYTIFGIAKASADSLPRTTS